MYYTCSKQVNYWGMGQIHVKTSHAEEALIQQITKQYKQNFIRGRN